MEHLIAVVDRLSDDHPELLRADLILVLCPTTRETWGGRAVPVRHMGVLGAMRFHGVRIAWGSMPAALEELQRLPDPFGLILQHRGRAASKATQTRLTDSGVAYYPPPPKGSQIGLQLYRVDIGERGYCIRERNDTVMSASNIPSLPSHAASEDDEPSVAEVEPEDRGTDAAAEE